MSDESKHARFIQMAGEAAAADAFACIVCPCGQVVLCGPEDSKMSVDTTARFIGTAMIAFDSAIEMVARDTGVPLADVREAVIASYRRGRLAGLVAIERSVEPPKN